MRLLLVTGSGTGVGKTIATAALASCAVHSGLSVAVVKPIQTGVGPDEAGDVDEVRRLVGIGSVQELVRFDEPLAPATAARRAGQEGPSLEQMADGILAWREHDLLVVEGAGGALVRLNSSGHTILDLARELQSRIASSDSLGILLIASCSLGTLHSTAATALAVRQAHLRLDSLIVSDWPTSDPDLAQVCNLVDLPQYALAPLHGVLPVGMGALDQTRFAEQARQGLAPALGGVCNTAEFVRLASRP